MTVSAQAPGLESPWPSRTPETLVSVPGSHALCPRERPAFRRCSHRSCPKAAGCGRHCTSGLMSGDWNWVPEITSRLVQ